MEVRAVWEKLSDVGCIRPGSMSGVVAIMSCSQNKWTIQLNDPQWFSGVSSECICISICFWLAALILIIALWILHRAGSIWVASPSFPLSTEPPKAQISAVHEFCHICVISSVIYLIALTYIFLFFVPEQNLISFWGSWKKQDLCDQYVSQPSHEKKGTPNIIKKQPLYQSQHQML